MTKYVLLYGNRRLDACKKLGWKTIKAKLGDEIKDIEISDIDSRVNIRTNLHVEDATELISSIKQDGLLQPIGVTKEEDYDEKEFKILNAVENIQREDIKPIEFGKFCHELREQFNMSLGEIAARFGVAKSRVEIAIRMYRSIPEEYRDCIGYVVKGNERKKGGKIPITVATAVLNIHRITQSQMKELLNEVKKRNLTTTDIGRVRSLMENGISLQKALTENNSIKTLRMNLPVKKVVATKLIEQYQESIGNIVRKMLKGEIPLEMDLTV